MSKRLNETHIGQLSERLPCPSYDRSSHMQGIVHIGVGGFHRSHQAYYIHQLLENHEVDDWAICGVGLRAADRNMAEVLKAQDGLYTLVTQYPDGKEKSEVIGSITEYLLAFEAPDLVINKMAAAETRIVSLTITEGGYNFNPVTGEFDYENPDILHDLATPDEPKTVFGFLAGALRQRYRNGIPPFTILSCDNIQHNGDVARTMVLAFAERQDAELFGWIAKEVCFPNTMVDRITPVTTPEISDYLKDEYGYIDEWPVVCEPFIQWVVEDEFSDGRPPLEKVGVQFVPDVTPYERMKIRLLNAGHSVLGITGAIHGHKTIDACMDDPLFASFMRKFMDEEVTPVLGEVAGIDIEEYKDSLEQRFANPNIKDSVSRICSESSAKLPKFLIPTLRENLERGGSIKYASFVLAAWCYYSDKGVNENGETIEIIDDMKTTLHSAAKGSAEDETAFLQLTEIFGDLKENERFVKAYAEMVKSLYGEKNISQIISELQQAR